MTRDGERPVEGGIVLPEEPSATDEAPRPALPAGPAGSRLSAGRLHHVASRLGVPVASFFEGSAEGTAAGQASAPERAAEASRLLNGFDRIADPFLRRSLLDLVEGLAAGRDGA